MVRTTATASAVSISSLVRTVKKATLAQMYSTVIIGTDIQMAFGSVLTTNAEGIPFDLGCGSVNKCNQR